MGDLSMSADGQLALLLLCLPCFTVALLLARSMNILLAGREAAIAMGVNVRRVSSVLLPTTSLMVSLVVCLSGLIGFGGLIIPHLFRLLLGPDHRLLGHGCLLGGAGYLVLCDLLARTLPQQGEMPVGVITALIGAPLFLLLLWRARRALSLADISLAYGGNTVVDWLSLCVDPGEFFMIIGPNGAGKSSLLKIIAGIEQVRSGRVEILGRPQGSYSSKELARKIALVAQQASSDFPFTVAETVLMGRSPHLRLLEREGEKDCAIALEAMRFTGFDHLSDHRLDQLSGGERQRVMIARAICQQPGIILLDEPTTALDPAHQVRIMDLMELFRQEKGTTVIMVSHDLNLAAMYADRLLLMK